MGNLGVHVVKEEVGPIIRICDICDCNTTEVVYKNEYWGDKYCVCVNCLVNSNEIPAVRARADLQAKRRKGRR